MRQEAFRILVAEDNAVQRTILELLLCADDYDVILTEDGQEALEYLQTHTPDLMILDVKMPHLGGIDLCGRTKKVTRLKPVPVVLLTAHVDDIVRTEAQFVGADALYEKPVVDIEFCNLIRSILGREPLPPKTREAQAKPTPKPSLKLALS